MDMNKSFGQDDDAVKNGKWFDLENGGKVKVASMDSPLFRVEVMRLQKPHLALLQSSMDTTELNDKITVIAMSRTILNGWEGITVDGKAVKVSSENAEMLFKKFPSFKKLIAELATTDSNFNIEELAKK